MQNERKSLGSTSQTMTPMTPDTLFGDKVLIFRRIKRMLHAFKSAYEAELGINPLVAWIITLLAQNDGLTQNELMTCMDVDPSMITRIVKDMEQKQGWIRRERDAADNRLMRVYLTEEGRVQAQYLPERSAEIEHRLIRLLSDQDMETLDRIADAMEKAVKRSDVPR